MNLIYEAAMTLPKNYLNYIIKHFPPVQILHSHLIMKVTQLEKNSYFLRTFLFTRYDGIIKGRIKSAHSKDVVPTKVNALAVRSQNLHRLVCSGPTRDLVFP